MEKVLGLDLGKIDRFCIKEIEEKDGIRFLMNYLQKYNLEMKIEEILEVVEEEAKEQVEEKRLLESC